MAYCKYGLSVLIKFDTYPVNVFDFNNSDNIPIKTPQIKYIYNFFMLDFSSVSKFSIGSSKYSSNLILFTSLKFLNRLIDFYYNSLTTDEVLKFYMFSRDVTKLNKPKIAFRGVDSTVEPIGFFLTA